MSESAVRRAMVLAAGLGTRLRPVTDHLPKPLLTVLERPLLQIICQNLQDAGVTRYALNSHHRAGQIRQWVARSAWRDAIQIFHEPEILGTGGGVANARAFLEQEACFFLHNGDVLTDIDLAALAAAHLQHGPVATLALVDWDAVNTVLLGPGGEITGIDRNTAGRADRTGAAAPTDTQPPTSAGGRWLTYTGIAVCSREIFQYLPATGFSSLVDALLQAMTDRPGAVRGWAPPHVYWNDLGSLDRYLAAHRDILVAGRLPAARGHEQDPDGSPVFRAANAEIADDATLVGFVSAGRGSRIEAQAHVQNCVLLPGAVVASGRQVRDALIGPDWIVTTGEVTLQDIVTFPGVRDWLRSAGFAPDTRVQPITGHGSDRSFWRLTALAPAPGATGSTSSAVLMHTPPGVTEFDRYLAIGTFLHTLDLGAPEILTVHRDSRFVLLEDLGDESLYRLATAPHAAPGLHEVVLRYHQAIDLLVDIQTRGTAAMHDCPAASDREFDYPTLRWETDYFRRRFLVDLAGLPPDEAGALDEEFHRLATAALAQPQVLMHRDFQSQNILYKAGWMRLVDFQGMRRGPLAYDLMSLLRDAYVDLDALGVPDATDDPTGKLRDQLLHHYRIELASCGGPDLASEQLRTLATVAGLQRNMQALGAFAYLSRVKEKRSFLRFIPLGLQHLAAGLAELTTQRISDPAMTCGRLARLESIVQRLLPIYPLH